MTRKGHRQLDHTADLAMEVWAPDEPALLEEAALALVGVMRGGATDAGTALPVREITLEALDSEDRLVRWLNEVIFLAVNDGFVLQAAELTLSGDTGVRGRLQGVDVPLVGELKAVTYHDLSLVLQDTCRAVFVVDV